MRRGLNSLLFWCLGVVTWAQVSHSCPLTSYGTDPYVNPLEERWLSSYDVIYYDLQLWANDTTTFIEGTARILIEFLEDTDTLVLELQDSLRISEIGFQGYDPVSDETLLGEFSHTGDAVFIQMEGTAQAGEKVFIKVVYEGLAGQNKGFFAGISSVVDQTYGFPVTYTLSEPQNAKDWFPVKQVLTDQIDSASVRITCADHLMAASNGVLVEILPGENATHTFHWITQYRTAYYLLSFAVSDYRDFSFYAQLENENDSVLVQNYVYDTDELLSDWEDDIRNTGQMITLYSQLLMDYPFASEKYGHAMAPMGGGMEHQTMTTIQNFNFYLVAHELAHQWFGDYITCRSWQDIWINEGFASYMEYVAAEELLGIEIARGWMDNAMSIALGETEGSVFVPSQEVENSFRLFDFGLTYKKGAILLHMIRYRLNDDSLFFKVLREYLTAYGNELAGGKEFMAVLEQESGMDFSCFFEQWYYGEGFPRFNVHWFQREDSLVMTSEQTTSVPAVTPFFSTPFDLEIIYEDGSTNRVRLIQGEPAQEYSIPVDGLVSQVLFDPDQWLLKSANVIPRIPSEKRFIFGPNPVSGELVIHFRNSGHIDQVMITSLSGQELVICNQTSNPVTMDLSLLSDGPYLLVMQEENYSYVERILKVSGD